MYDVISLSEFKEQLKRLNHLDISNVHKNKDYFKERLKSIFILLYFLGLSAHDLVSLRPIDIDLETFSREKAIDLFGSDKLRGKYLTIKVNQKTHYLKVTKANEALLIKDLFEKFKLLPPYFYCFDELRTNNVTVKRNGKTYYLHGNRVKYWCIKCFGFSCKRFTFNRQALNKLRNDLTKAVETSQAN